MAEDRLASQEELAAWDYLSGRLVGWLAIFTAFF
jgi:hypothetical protein